MKKVPKTGRTDRREGAHHGTGVVEARQAKLDHHGRDGGEDGGGSEEPEGGDEDDRHGAASGQYRSQQVHEERRGKRGYSSGHEQGTQHPGGVSPVGGPSPQPGPQGDPRQDHPDYPGEHFETHPEIGSE